MLLRCIRPFGNFLPEHEDAEGKRVPADTVEVPDGAQFDPAYFEYAELKLTPPPAKEKAPSADAKEGSE